jgi:hypothetical protein
MPFNFHRFNNSLDAHAGSADKDRILQSRPPFDSLTTSGQRSKWIENLMKCLNEVLGDETARQVMQACGTQCIGQSTLEKVKRLQRGCGSLDDLLERLNQAHIGGGKMHREGEVIYASYERCYCGSVSKGRQSISATYCSCSCGWYQQLFETLLEKPVQVELVDSIIHGADICRFIIHL